MDLKVLFLTECLDAAWKRTLERLCPIMKMHVGLKTNLTLKELIASGLRAEEKLGLLHSIFLTLKTNAFVFVFLFGVIDVVLWLLTCSNRLTFFRIIFAYYALTFGIY